MYPVKLIKDTSRQVVNHVNSHQLTRIDGTLEILDAVLSMCPLQADNEMELATFLVLLLWPEA